AGSRAESPVPGIGLDVAHQRPTARPGGSGPPFQRRGHRPRLGGPMERFLREYQEIVEIGTAFNANLRVGKVCENFYREVFRIVPAGTVTAIALYVHNEEEQRYEFLLAHREGSREDDLGPIPFGRWSFADWARVRNRNLFIPDGRAHGLTLDDGYPW